MYHIYRTSYNIIILPPVSYKSGFVIILYVTGFAKTVPNRTFGISRNTELKYSSHCSTFMLDCSHAGFTAEVQYNLIEFYN